MDLSFFLGDFFLSYFMMEVILKSVQFNPVAFFENEHFLAEFELSYRV